MLISESDGVGCWTAIGLGDSRVYLLRDGRLVQVTVDHSLVQQMVDAGRITPEQARTDSRRNIITGALGAGSDQAPDIWQVPAETGDRLLICSDGLSDDLDADQLREILAIDADPASAAATLVRAALVAGGRDNITAVVVDALAVADADATRIVPTGTEREAVA